MIFKNCNADFFDSCTHISAAPSALLLPSGIAPQGGVVLVAVLCCRKYYGVTYKRRSRPL